MIIVVLSNRRDTILSGLKLLCWLVSCFQIWLFKVIVDVVNIQFSLAVYICHSLVLMLHYILSLWRERTLRVGHILGGVLFIQLFYHLWVLKGLVQALVAANTVWLLNRQRFTLINFLNECGDLSFFNCAVAICVKLLEDRFKLVVVGFAMSGQHFRQKSLGEHSKLFFVEQAVFVGIEVSQDYIYLLLNCELFLGQGRRYVSVDRLWWLTGRLGLT